jgi:hypothetical protein
MCKKWILFGVFGLLFTSSIYAQEKNPPISTSVIPGNYQTSNITLSTRKVGNRTYYTGTFPSKSVLTFYPANGGNWNGASALILQARSNINYEVNLNITVNQANGLTFTSSIHLIPGIFRTLIFPFQSITFAGHGFYESPPLVQYPDNQSQQVDSNSVSPFNAQWAAPTQVTSVTLQLQNSSPVSVTFGQPELETGGVISNVYTNLIDTFGQSTLGIWPEKVSSVADMESKYHIETQQLRLWTADRSDLDRFGGTNSIVIPNKSSFFRTARVNGRWWLVTPSGHGFFQLGIDLVDTVDGYTTISNRESMFENIVQQRALFPDQLSPDNAQPGLEYFNFFGANVEKQFGNIIDPKSGLPNDIKEFKARATWRLEAWRFNTVGDSSNKTFLEQPTLPFVHGLKVRDYYSGPMIPGYLSYHFGPLPDPYAPAFTNAVQQMVQGIPKYLVTQNYLIGYFVDNELAWGNAKQPSDYQSHFAIPIAILSLNYDTSPAKQAFLSELKKKHQSYQALARAWKIPLTSWDQLKAPFTSMPHTASAALTRDLSTFLSSFANQYFGIITKNLKTYDPNHLYLGCRFTPDEEPPEVVSACETWCDVVSTNLYDYILQPSEKAFFGSLRKPSLISEFGFGSTDRGPFWGGIKDAGSEQYRGSFYANYVNSIAADPNVIGCDWYEYGDQPATGTSYPDENGHIGFVSVANVAYQSLVTTARQVNLSIAKVHLKGR